MPNFFNRYSIIHFADDEDAKIAEELINETYPSVLTKRKSNKFYFRIVDSRASVEKITQDLIDLGGIPGGCPSDDYVYNQMYDP